MALWAQLHHEIALRLPPGMEQLKAIAALKTLERLLPKLEVPVLPTSSGTVCLSEIIVLPGGHEQRWVVYGDWGDGTFDLVKEGGIYTRDTLVGWKPGQSEREYWAEIKKEFPDEPDGSALPAGDGVPEKEEHRGILPELAWDRLRGDRREQPPKRGRKSRARSGDKEHKAGSPPPARAHQLGSARTVAEQLVVQSRFGAWDDDED